MKLINSVQRNSLTTTMYSASEHTIAALYRFQERAVLVFQSEVSERRRMHQILVAPQDGICCGERASSDRPY